MSILFTHGKIGKMETENRFVHSATYESMASDAGEVTDKLMRRYSKIAKGGAGLIIPGYMYIMPSGRAMKYQTGIHDDKMIAGLKKLVDVVHDKGSKIALPLYEELRKWPSSDTSTVV